MTRPADRTPRLAALKLIGAVLDEGRNLGDSEPSDHEADARDRAFARHLAYGVLRWLTALDWLAGQLLKRPLRRKDRDVHRLILIGLFQLWKDGTAAHAAIHESAEGARKLGKTWAVSVVNAVLRRFQREQQALLRRLNEREDRFSHPAWLLEQLKTEWPDRYRDIMTANNRPGPLWLRINRRFETAGTVELLEREGFAVERHPVAGDALRITPAVPVNTLPGFRAGRLSVQDPAAQLAAELLDIQPQHRVLDACAAPGGKACHLLEKIPDLHLTALDRSPQRLERITENLDRLGMARAPALRLLAADAAEPGQWWDGAPFNRILLDAPCSATGVIRRHPEIKWLRDSGQVRKAADLQARLLRRLWPLLEAGGILLYATCSLLRDENQAQLEKFVEQHPDAEVIDIDAKWGHDLGHGRQILPGEQEMDGFFYARLRKNP